jgi:hypothetical protein
MRTLLMRIHPQAPSAALLGPKSTLMTVLGPSLPFVDIHCFPGEIKTKNEKNAKTEAAAHLYEPLSHGPFQKRSINMLQ